jgi:hypothetical protein
MPVSSRQTGGRLLGQVGRIDDHRPGLSENGDGLAHDVALPGLVHERRARNADAGALQSACVQMTRRSLH